jgi:hypothetical protein
MNSKFISIIHLQFQLYIIGTKHIYAMLGAIANVRYVFSLTRSSSYGPRPNTSLIPRTGSEQMAGMY